MPLFRAPRAIYTGRGCRLNIGEVAVAIGGKAALVVTDPAVKSAEPAAEVIANLGAAGLRVSVFDGVTAEPTVSMVEKGLEICRAQKCDIVIGLGGGSPMDTAKAIAVIAPAKRARIADFEGANKIPPGRLRLILLSATAGTGSEVTPYTIITDQSRDVKMLIASPELLADASFADPALTDSVPRRPAIFAGLDALTHAIEAYVSRRAQPITDVLALSAIARIGGNIVEAVSDHATPSSRDQMTLGALEAGLAFANSSVALVHGMARPIGALFHLPHGLCNAMLLRRVMEFSVDAAVERYADIARALGCELDGMDARASASAGVSKVQELTVALDTPGLRKAGVQEGEFERVVEKMARDALASGSPGNNPRQPTEQEIVALYRDVL